MKLEGFLELMTQNISYRKFEVEVSVQRKNRFLGMQLAIEPETLGTLPTWKGVDGLLTRGLIPFSVQTISLFQKIISVYDVLR